MTASGGGGSPHRTEERRWQPSARTTCSEPSHRTGRPLPVVLYSHGAGSHRADHTIVVQELASHGFAVVTVDHTHDGITEFPDGTVVTRDDVAPGLYPRDYAADLLFLLERVVDLANGRNPDVDGRALPVGLLGGLDARNIGVSGWSKGGTAAARFASRFTRSEPRGRALEYMAGLIAARPRRQLPAYRSGRRSVWRERGVRSRAVRPVRCKFRGRSDCWVWWCSEHWSIRVIRSGGYGLGRPV
ncbi:hypothetical protein [Kitasatospora sp. NPDC087314]|uniref:alpha/beta hydrolase n=1 Tax=Kitasatospora sp. NPDC087314 TaxID=3364068 RepID=UPI003829F8B7